MKSKEYYKKRIEEQKKRESDFYQILIKDYKTGLLTDDKKAILNIYDAFHNKMNVEIQLLRYGKGGFDVDLFGVKAFMPYSVSYIPRNNLNVLKSKLEANVIKVNCDKLNFVVGRHLIVRKEFNGKEPIFSPSIDINELSSEKLDFYKELSKIFYRYEEYEDKYNNSLTTTQN